MIKLQDQHYSRFYTSKHFRNRFLRLQKLVQQLDIDGLLVILGRCFITAGIDSNFDQEMQKCANWLLYGLSGHDVNGSPPDQLFSDSVFVVSRDSFQMLVSNKAYKRIAPLAANISNCNVKCFTRDHELNEDIMEAVKIAQFYEMVFDKPKLAMPLASQPQDIQKWPLIQAYALDTIGGGFFSMKHQVTTPSKISTIYEQHDAFSLSRLYRDEVQKLNLHVYQTLFKLNKAHDKYAMSEAEIAESFTMRYEFGQLSLSEEEQKETTSLPGPRVLSGVRTALPKNEKSSPAPLSESNPAHFTLQFVERTSALRMARTYFFSNLNDENKEIALPLSHIYLAAVQTYSKNIAELFNGSQQLKNKLLEELKGEKQKKILQGAEIKVTSYSYNSMAHESDLGQLLYLLRLQIDGLEIEGSSVGKLLYCDTFLRLEEGRFHCITDSVPAILYFTPRIDKALPSPTFPKIKGFLKSATGFSQVLHGQLALSSQEVLFLENRLGMIKIPLEELKRVNIFSHQSQTWLELDSTSKLPLDKSQSLLLRLTSQFLSSSFLKLSKMMQESKIEVLREESLPYANELAFANLKSGEARGVLGYCDTSEEKPNTSVLDYLTYEELVIQIKEKAFLSYEVFSDVFEKEPVSKESDSDEHTTALKNVIFISGIPGSGKTLLAESLVRSMNQVSKVAGDWICVKSPFSSKIKFSPSKLFARLQEAKCDGVNNYVVPIPGYHHLKKVVYHFKGQSEFNSTYKVKAVITKVHAKNFYQSRDKLIYQYLLENCAEGLCDAVVLERSFVPDSEINQIISILESVHGAAIVKTKHRNLDKLSFSSIQQIFKKLPQRERINKFHLKFNYAFEKEGKSEYYSDRVPIQSECIRFKAPLKSEFLKTKLLPCFVRGYPLPFSPNFYDLMSGYGIQSEQFFSDLIEFNKMKYAGKGIFLERIQGQIHLEGQEGLVQNIFANCAQVSLRVEKGTPTSDQMELIIFGRNLGEFAEFLNQFRTPPQEKLPLKERNSLTKEELTEIETKNANLYIPDGIVFDGKMYYDFEGHSYEHHPNLESLIDKYLEEENARIGEYNRKIAKEEMAKKKLYS